MRPTGTWGAWLLFAWSVLITTNVFLVGCCRRALQLFRSILHTYSLICFFSSHNLVLSEEMHQYIYLCFLGGVCCVFCETIHLKVPLSPF